MAQVYVIRVCEGWFLLRSLPYSRGSCRPFQGGGSHINVSATAANNKAGATGVKYNASFTAPTGSGAYFSKEFPRAERTVMNENG